MDKLKIVKPTPFKLKGSGQYNEKWLQEYIFDDPGCLGLGDLKSIQREKPTAGGGRLDILLKDDDNETLYEVEVMLGKTDESHIIRTIEYWDLERRRYPNYNHVAVIVAEDITNRFFNVISLLNKSIPIIAIKIHSLEVEGKLIVDFIKILDLSEQENFDELEENRQEGSSRNYWEDRCNQDALAVVDEIISLCKNNSMETNPIYNRSHIAMSSKVLNFCWLEPRIRQKKCLIKVKTGEENVSLIEEDMSESNIEIRRHRTYGVKMSLNLKILQEEKDNILKILKCAYENCSK